MILCFSRRVRLLSLYFGRLFAAQDGEAGGHRRTRDSPPMSKKMSNATAIEILPNIGVVWVNCCDQGFKAARTFR